ncbi:endonuclease/exonuclease/phosphatase family protein [Polyangium jinanense]|uniref:Endonuclease/exonuclease/phosphatase family protein n=1 Tax=Polyangium jinanense TaxID=2829994 RepID=A0A9X3XH45_9BACT|nr:endonuclease/exonuclease/phosphatase family protein [Polyangium jinanense]MDC3962383.1 endonuclease/exonuclease/phosphatase family protein [Polyangium jinanense]MDC3989275.1 endonuclease/exonuclease/phosphatase family protein [Polyangium jinanense]
MTRSDVVPSPGSRVAPDGSVTFAYRDERASSVLVAGDFTGWGKDPIPLVKREGTDLWVLTTRPLPRGVHAYKLVVDGLWTADPANPLDVDDGLGGRNSAFVVGGRNLGDPGAIRVLSLNLHTYQERGLREGVVVNDSIAKIERIAFGVATMGLDVLLLQEVGEHVSNPAEPNAGRLLQEHLERFTRRRWEHVWREAHIGFDVYREGLSILSSGPIEDVTVLQLSEGPLARIALLGRTTVKGTKIRVGTTHVSWGSDGGTQVARLLADVARLPAGDHVATLFAGDLNGSPEDRQVASFVERGYTDIGMATRNVWPTFGEKTLTSRIDYQMLRASAGRRAARIEAFVRVFDGEGPEDGLHPRVSDHAGIVGAYRWD